MNKSNFFKVVPRKFVLIILSTFFNFLTFAQSISDIATMKVDNLSDAQISKLIKDAELAGIGGSKFIDYAKERGMQPDEIEKLKIRIDNLPQQTEKGKFNLLKNKSDSELNGLSKVRSKNESLTVLQKRIFGFSLFFNSELNFNPVINLPTPPGYILGSEDELLIDIYGASQKSFNLKLSSDGKIFVPNIGPIDVGGLTISAASSRIKNNLSKIYSGLQTGTTFMELRLGEIRTVKVSMVGELNNPGNYTLPSFATPFNALFAAGGPNENGSFRKIQVYRSNKLLTEVDIYDFLTKGESTSSIALQDNDVIVVPPYGSRIEVLGGVKREGLFELKSGEKLNDLIKYAGGFSSDAYSSIITVRRNSNIDLKIEEIESNEFSNFAPIDGDIFTIGKILDKYRNRVQVSGAVNRPGTYSLESNSSLANLISKAQGLRPDAFSKKIIIYRTNDDFSLAINSVDFHKILSGEAKDITLKSEDLVYVSSRFDIREHSYLKISGEINNPSTFIYGDNTSLLDLVQMSGGFKQNADLTNIEVVRREMQSNNKYELKILNFQVDTSNSSHDFSPILKPFDQIYVRSNPFFKSYEYAKVEGEVKYPGEYILVSNGEVLSDLIKRSGGLTNFSFANGATLIRRNENYPKENEQDRKLKILRSLKANLMLDSSNPLVLNGKIDQMIQKLYMENMQSNDSRDPLDLIKSTRGLKSDTLKGFENINEGIKIFDIIGIDLESILFKNNAKEDLLLQDGDLLFIPKKLETVRIRGEVLNPTSVKYDNGRGFKYYINSSGGFNINSKKNLSYIIYPNGKINRTRKIFIFNQYPKVLPGSEIVVPEIPANSKFNAQSYINTITSTISSALTLFLLVNSVLK